MTGAGHMDDLSRDVYGVLGVPIDAVDLSAVVQRIGAAMRQDAPFLISTPNLNFLVTSQTDSEFRESLFQSDLCPVDGVPIEGTFRSHQVPLTDFAGTPAHISLLEEWMLRYRPQELFDEGGRLRADLAALAPTGNRRMGANPAANGGTLLRDLQLPPTEHYAIPIAAPGTLTAESTNAATAD